MKKSLNILHFSLFLIEKKLHALFNSINPAILLFKIPSVRKRMKENEGIENPSEWYDDFWIDKKKGLGVKLIGGWLIGIVTLTFIGLSLITIKIITPEFALSTYLFIPFGLVSYLICYVLVFKNDLYLSYFKEFETWSIIEKRRNTLISMGFILMVVLLFFLGVLYP